MQEKRTTVFIGSSKEGLRIAQAIQLELEADAICTIWYQGVFGLSKGTLQSLYDALPNFEFDILVLTPDDLVVFRDQVVQLPRDNVLFELGLFMGHLGPERVFVVYCDDGQTKLPSDLAGISLAKFRKLDETRKISSFSTNELLPLLGLVGSKIRMSIQKIGNQQPIDVTVHYIVPSLSHNDYYARFQGRLETELSKIKNISWYYHPPKGDSPQDIYLELAEILKIMRFNDAVILVPKELNNPQLLNQFEELLDQNPSGKIILIDQQAVKVLQVISGIAVDLQIPELYPVSIEFQKLLRDEKFEAFWESSS